VGPVARGTLEERSVAALRGIRISSAMRVLALVVMVACSTAKPQERRHDKVEPRAQAAQPLSSATSSPSAPSRAEVALEDLVAADASGLARMPPEFFVVLLETDKLADPAERCWSRLKSQLIAGYHVMMPSASSASQWDAYFVAEGAMPRVDVEQCAQRAFKGVGLEVHPAGELTAFSIMGRTAYAAWRGQFLLVGPERLISAALRTPTHDTAARWRALIGQVPRTTPMWVLSIDQRPTNASAAIGAPTTDIMFMFDKMQRTPRPLIAGRFVAHYPSAAMAAKSAAWIRSWSTRGEFPFVVPPPANLVEIYHRMAKGIAGLKLTQERNRVQIDWDSDLLGGIEQMGSFFDFAGEQLKRAP
jgi:hypothetical protein